jgi:hypothetical protein
MITKNTEIWLTGTDAYRRSYGQFITREKKSTFDRLLANVNDAIVFLNKTTVKRYIDKIVSLGYKVLSNEEYDMFSIRIKIEKVN